METVRVTLKQVQCDKRISMPDRIHPVCHSVCQSELVSDSIRNHFGISVTRESVWHASWIIVIVVTMELLRNSWFFIYLSIQIQHYVPNKNHW